MIIELKKCDYQGVDFLFESMATTGGNRLIKYRYPGSNKQSVEVQGSVPRSFTLSAIIPHDDYYNKKEALERVLNNGKSGVLNHPTYGLIDNVINGLYTIKEIASELGKARLSIPFEIDDSAGVPAQSSNLPSQVQEQNALLLEVFDGDIESYTITSSAMNNYTDAFDIANNIVASFDAVLAIGDPITDQANEMRADIDSLANNVGELTDSPLQLKAAIDTLFASVENLYETPEETYSAFKSIFGFGDDDEEIIPTTYGLTERLRNRKLMKGIMKTQALGYAYLNAVQVDYSTTEALELAQDELDDQYKAIRDEIIYEDSTGLAVDNHLISNEAQERIDRLRVQAQLNFDDLTLNTKDIITVTINGVRPLAVIVYAYYGSTELTDTIADLNDLEQSAFVSGEIRMLAA